MIKQKKFIFKLILTASLIAKFFYRLLKAYQQENKMTNQNVNKMKKEKIKMHHVNNNIIVI